MSLFISKVFLVSLAAVGATSAVATAVGIVGPNSPVAAPRAWAEPIPGVDVIVRKNPGGSMFRLKTDAEGRIRQPLQPGEYHLSLSWEQAVRAASKPTTTAPGTNASGGGGGAGKVDPSITLVTSYQIGGSGGKRQHEPILIDREWKGHSFKVEFDGIFSGQLLATPRK